MNGHSLLASPARSNCVPAGLPPCRLSAMVVAGQKDGTRHPAEQYPPLPLRHPAVHCRRGGHRCDVHPALLFHWPPRSCLPERPSRAAGARASRALRAEAERPAAAAGRRRAGLRSRSSTARRWTGWEGNPKYWRVENGALVGEITPETVIKSNTFIDLARRPAAGFRAEARLPHHRRRQQRHQLPQRGGARSGDAGQQVRDEGLSVRHRRQAGATPATTTRRRAACSSPSAAR